MTDPRRQQFSPDDPLHQARLLAAIVEATDLAIESMTLEGILTSWNQGAARMYGYSAGEILGSSIEFLIPDDRRGEMHQVLERIRGGERVAPFDTVRRTRDGRLIDVAVSVSPVTLPSGSIIGVAKIARDVTDRWDADEKLRLAFDDSPTGVLMIDEQGRIVLINAEVERLFGYPRAELIGQPVEMLVPPRLRGQHAGYRTGFAAQPAKRLMGPGRNLFGRRKDGSEFPVEIGLNPIRARSGPLLLCAVLDITQRKQEDETRTEQTHALQRSNTDLEQFAYVASHDLQEPLRMVVSYTELLAERYQGKLDEKADKFIRYIVEGAKRLQQLVADLLAYSRVGTQGRPLQPIRADEVLHTTLEGMRSAIADARAEIINDPLPVVNADRVQLAQLLQNLISNALKFRAERPPLLRISAQPDGDSWTFAVQDNGIGIEKAHSQQIFQMFQRLHPRGKYDGSGIGLAIAKKIVERHGGRIWFDSVPGEGTTFYFTLPVVPKRSR